MKLALRPILIFLALTTGAALICSACAGESAAIDKGIRASYTVLVGVADEQTTIEHSHTEAIIAADKAAGAPVALMQNHVDAWHAQNDEAKRLIEDGFKAYSAAATLHTNESIMTLSGVMKAIGDTMAVLRKEATP